MNDVTSRPHPLVTPDAPPATGSAAADPNAPSGTALDWHAESAERAVSRLASHATQGLSEQEAAERLLRFGPNRLPEPPRRTALKRLLLQFHNPLIHVLLGAAVVTLLLGYGADAAVILGVVIINAIIGFVQEGKAERALDAVRGMLASRANVLRAGVRREIDAQDLVPGDLVLLESGTRVPADLRLLRARNLRIDESPLTGESVPAEKGTDPVAPAAAIGDRFGMAYSGTTVSFGQGRGLVVATGTATEIGRIGVLVAGVASLHTPLTRRLETFARQITVFILSLGLLTYLYGHFVMAMPADEVFLAVVGLAVAAIPEGLPAIVTIALAIGTRIMARAKVIVRRLPAVETLGSVTVICSDKTGTLTRNEMTAVSLLLADRTLEVSGAGYAPDGGFRQEDRTLDPGADDELRSLARCALLCNDAHLTQDDLGHWVLAGDPTEGALLALALKAGLDPAAAALDWPRLDEIPFESDHRFMATLHRDHAGGGAWILLKGAPEQVLARCNRDGAGRPLDRAAWETRMTAAAAAGQRMLGLAWRAVPADTLTLDMRGLGEDFVLLGLAGLMDPPRPEAIAAVADCQRAGIRVVMITGDHAVTAAAIAAELGLNAQNPLTGEIVETLDDAALRERARSTDVIARASPEHKLRLVAALQADGQFVAMTGDGVNDAPALKAAEIGVAMGQRGTDAAREAADLVLTDDNFASIAQAVREGRRVFDNIKKSLVFILPTNTAQAGVILLAILLGLALPITASQILWVNMVTAVTLALALAFEPAEAGAMRRPPRPPTEPMITRVMLIRILSIGLLMIVLTFGVHEWELLRGQSLEAARTAAVNMLVFGELVYLFNVRQFTAPTLSRQNLGGNPMAFWMAGLLVILQVLFTYAPPFQAVFHTQGLDLMSWAVILGLSAVAFAVMVAEKRLLRNRGVERL